VKKTEVLDEVLDIFIRKAMEETSLDLSDNRNTLAENMETKRAYSLSRPKHKDSRGDMNEVYTTAGVR